MTRARRDRAAGAGVYNRRLPAIAFIDIVGYSILMATDEARTHTKWMTMLNDVIRPGTARRHGRIVRSECIEQ
jgi:adenylate cyclase